ncbi:MAG: hypothetical protein HY892_20505 [Deltaproteobacteria bacterium]|nr:hypothetical protein [Deltaproteobacteria bacterium]
MPRARKEPEKINSETAGCPVARLFSEMEKAYGRKSDFFNHLHQSQIEFLKAVRSLVDDRIGELEKKQARGKKKATKVEVE